MANCCVWVEITMLGSSPVPKSWLPRLSGLLDAWAPNTPDMLKLSAPNALKQSRHLQLNKAAVHASEKSKNLKAHQVPWWKDTFVCDCKK